MMLYIYIFGNLLKGFKVLTRDRGRSRKGRKKAAGRGGRRPAGILRKVCGLGPKGAARKGGLGQPRPSSKL